MMINSVSRSIALPASSSIAGRTLAAGATSSATTGFTLPTSSQLTSAAISAVKTTTSNGSLGFDFDFSYNNIDHTQAEYNAYYAEGAKKISESQGLPAGQYDFTKISAQQAHIIANDMIVNQGKTPDDVMGLTMVISNATWYGGIDSDASKTKVDALDMIKTQADFEKSMGNSTAERFLNGTLSILTSVQSASRPYANDISSLSEILKNAASRQNMAR